MGPRRSLILSGGALRAAYQSGVLRALDEAGLTFHHADATSGGAITLAMLLSGHVARGDVRAVSTLPTQELVSLMSLPEYLSGLHVPAIGDAPRMYGHQRPIRLHVLKSTFPLPFEPEYYLGRMDAGTLVALGYRDAQRYLESVAPGGVPPGPNRHRDDRPTSGCELSRDPHGTLHARSERSRRGRPPRRGGQHHVDARGVGLLPRHGRLHRGCTRRGVGGLGVVTFGHPRPPCQGGPFHGADQDRKPDAHSHAVRGGVRGTPYCLLGRKELTERPDVDQWAEATTLVARLHVGVDGSGPVVGAGVLRLRMRRGLAPRRMNSEN